MNRDYEDKNIINMGEYKSKNLESSLSLDSSLRNPAIQIVDDKIYHISKENGEVNTKVIGKKVEIEKISKNIESNEVKYDLNIYTFDGRVVSIKGLDRKTINDRSQLLSLLSGLGSEINSSNAKYYIGSLENQEKTKKIYNFHQKVGWGKYEDKRIFKHLESIGIKDGQKSEYKGQLDISKSGTTDEWISFLREEVTGHTPLEAAIGIGLSSVVLGYIGESIGVTSQMFHIYGDSSTGKTTVGELIIGTATKPTLLNNGLMHSWNSTANAIIGNIRNNFGLPVLLDDSSVSKVRDFSAILYQIVQGRDKDRMNKDGSLRESECWRTTIVSTGEQSLLSNSNENEGIRVRVIEIGNIAWTTDALHSERIKRKSNMYYGHGVNIVAEELLSLGEDKVLKLVERSKVRGKTYLESKGKYSRLHDRILNSISAVEIAITILEQKLKLGFNIEHIMNFIIDHTLMDDRSMSDKAYEDLLEYVTSNTNRFNQNIFDIKIDPIRKNINRPGFGKKDRPKYEKKQILINSNQKLIGKIEDITIDEVMDDDSGKKLITIEREILIPTNEFKTIMVQLGYTNSSGILKGFKDKGLLSYDSDRNTRKRKLVEGGSLIAVHVIKVRNITTLEENQEHQIPVVKETNIIGL